MNLLNNYKDSDSEDDKKTVSKLVINVPKVENIEYVPKVKKNKIGNLLTLLSSSKDTPKRKISEVEKIENDDEISEEDSDFFGLKTTKKLGPVVGPQKPTKDQINSVNHVVSILKPIEKSVPGTIKVIEQKDQLGDIYERHKTRMITKVDAIPDAFSVFFLLIT
jgi:hypothetical protein